MGPNRKLLLIAAGLASSLALMIVPLVAAGAAEPQSFKDVRLWIYPEYDDPRLLIMLEGKLVGVTPPATTRFLVPAAAEMYSAGSMDAQGKYSGGPPDRKPSAVPGWDEISYDVKTDTFRIEYYDPIIKGLPDKTIAYEFRTLYPISNLAVSVQEPRTSKNFSVQPKAESKGTVDGLPANLYTFRDVLPDRPLRFDIAYTKADSNPSVSTQTGSTPTVNNLTLIGILLGLVALGFGAYWLVSGTRSKPAPRAARHGVPSHSRGRPGGPARAQPGAHARAKFCSQCGAKVERPTRFCPRCGGSLE